jgi:hypothetical protein
LTVNTTSVAEVRTPGEPAALYAALSLPLVGFLIAGTMLPKSKKGKLGLLLGAIVLVALLALQLACGTGSAPPPPPPPPPNTRTFHVVVHASSGPIYQWTEATLKVTW